MGREYLKAVGSRQPEGDEVGELGAVGFGRLSEPPKPAVAIAHRSRGP